MARELSDLAGRLERNRPDKLEKGLDTIANLGLLAEAAIAAQKWVIAIADMQARTERFETRTVREAQPKR